MERYLEEKLPHSDVGNYVIIQMEAENEEDLENKSVQLDELCSLAGSIAVLVADSAKIWKARKMFTEATRSESLIQSYEDVVVPVDLIPKASEIISQLSKKHGLSFGMVSHAGDGNIHLNIMKGDLTNEQWDKQLEDFQDELYRLAYEIGGRLSGEHGIGYKRKGLMQKFTDPVELDMMRRIKKALDPNLILNPGKIFDMD